VGALEPMHLLIILFIVLLLFGAKRLPGLARSLGTSARELKKGLNEERTAGRAGTGKPGCSAGERHAELDGGRGERAGLRHAAES